MTQGRPGHLGRTAPDLIAETSATVVEAVMSLYEPSYWIWKM